MSDAALYAYAVLPAGALPPPAAPILPGPPPELVAEGALTALVNLVPRAPFAEGPECRMADPDWVAARASLHHGVVVAAAAGGPALPLAFGALFSGPEPVRAWLRAQAAPLTAALRLVEGCAEWGVTLAEDAPDHAAWLTAADATLAALAAALRQASPGQAYLLERKRDRALAAARARRRAEVAEATGLLLDRHARRTTTAAPKAAQGFAGWTALVPGTAVGALRADLDQAAAAMAGTGLRLALSGPWPAYAHARQAVQHG